MLLIDVNKTFDTIGTNLTNLLIAKLHACRFAHKSLKLICDFSSKQNFKTKISSSYSPWADLYLGVSQGSLLGSFLCVLFLFSKGSKIANCEDDITPYDYQDNLIDVQTKLGTNSLIFFYSLKTTISIKIMVYYMLLCPSL